MPTPMPRPRPRPSAAGLTLSQTKARSTPKRPEDVFQRLDTVYSWYSTYTQREQKATLTLGGVEGNYVTILKSFKSGGQSSVETFKLPVAIETSTRFKTRAANIYMDFKRVYEIVEKMNVSLSWKYYRQSFKPKSIARQTTILATYGKKTVALAYLYNSMTERVELYARVVKMGERGLSSEILSLALSTESALEHLESLEPTEEYYSELDSNLKLPKELDTEPQTREVDDFTHLYMGEIALYCLDEVGQLESNAPKTNPFEVFWNKNTLQNLIYPSHSADYDYKDAVVKYRSDAIHHDSIQFRCDVSDIQQFMASGAVRRPRSIVHFPLTIECASLVEAVAKSNDILDAAVTTIACAKSPLDNERFARVKYVRATMDGKMIRITYLPIKGTSRCELYMMPRDSFHWYPWQEWDEWKTDPRLQHHILTKKAPKIAYVHHFYNDDPDEMVIDSFVRSNLYEEMDTAEEEWAQNIRKTPLPNETKQASRRGEDAGKDGREVFVEDLPNHNPPPKDACALLAFGTDSGNRVATLSMDATKIVLPLEQEITLASTLAIQMIRYASDIKRVGGAHVYVKEPKTSLVTLEISRQYGCFAKTSGSDTVWLVVMLFSPLENKTILCVGKCVKGTQCRMVPLREFTSESQMESFEWEQADYQETATRTRKVFLPIQDQLAIFWKEKHQKSTGEKVARDVRTVEVRELSQPTLLRLANKLLYTRTRENDCVSPYEMVANFESDHVPMNTFGTFVRAAATAISEDGLELCNRENDVSVVFPLSVDTPRGAYEVLHREDVQENFTTKHLVVYRDQRFIMQFVVFFSPSYCLAYLPSKDKTEMQLCVGEFRKLRGKRVALTSNTFSVAQGVRAGATSFRQFSAMHEYSMWSVLWGKKIEEGQKWEVVRISRNKETGKMHLINYAMYPFEFEE